MGPNLFSLLQACLRRLIILKMVDVSGPLRVDGPQYFQSEGEFAMKRRNAFIRYLLVFVLIATFAACASTSGVEKVDDMALAANVKSALEADDSLRSFNIGIETRGGDVILSGWVSSQDTVVKAGQIARSVRGAQSVENNLRVR
jgi:hypothetical protein